MTLVKLWDNRPIRGCIGLISTDIGLAFYAVCCYTGVIVKANLLSLLWVQLLMDNPNTNVIVSELTFSLYQRPLHPELFNIYDKRQLKTEKYEALIWATGGAHVVGVFVNDLCLTELISSPSQLLPRRGLVERFKFKGQRNHKCTLARGLNYMTDFQVEKMSANLYRQSHTDLEKFARNRGIFVKFPEKAVAGLQPFTYIDFEVRRDELHIHAFHAYPDQVTIIKTQSLFDFH